jgi:hypothetical protein
MPANPEEIIGGASAGAKIGSAILPGWGTAIGAGVGGLIGVGKGWYDRHQDKKNRLRREALDAKTIKSRNEQLEHALLLQNESARQTIDMQLGKTEEAINTEFAGAGSYRTGARQVRIDDARRNAMTDIVRTAGSNALTAEGLKLGRLNSDRNFSLALAQMEVAKNTGNVDMVGQLGEQVAPLLWDKIFGGKSAGTEPYNVDSEGIEAYGEVDASLAPIKNNTGLAPFINPNNPAKTFAPPNYQYQMPNPVGNFSDPTSVDYDYSDDLDTILFGGEY